MVNILELANSKNLTGILGEFIVEAGFDGVAKGWRIAHILELALEGYWASARPMDTSPCSLVYRGIGTLYKPVGRGGCNNYALPSGINRKWVKTVLTDEWHGIWIYPPCVIHINPAGGFCLLEECVKALVSNSLWDLMNWLNGGSPRAVRGLELFNENERTLARKLFERMTKLDRERSKEVIEAIRRGDFFMMYGDQVVHVEVKTGRSRVNHNVIERAAILSELGVRTVVARVIPRDNWNVEIEIKSLERD